MNILLLLAGRASRFKEVGYKEPKPLIDAKGKPMVAWAIESLSFIKKPKYIVVCLKEQEDNFNISKTLKKFCKELQLIALDKVSEGAAASALLARELIDNDEELIISNGDQYFKSKGFLEELKKERKEFAGLIPVFEATHPRWSFAKLNEDNAVTEVAEKVPISNNATVGVYYFKKGRDFVWAAEEMIKKDIRRNNEFYVCPVFNELIGRGDKIKAVKADVMWSMGTPEDVAYFDKYFKVS